MPPAYGWHHIWWQATVYAKLLMQKQTFQLCDTHPGFVTEFTPVVKKNRDSHTQTTYLSRTQPAGHFVTARRLRFRHTRLAISITTVSGPVFVWFRSGAPPPGHPSKSAKCTNEKSFCSVSRRATTVWSS